MQKNTFPLLTFLSVILLSLSSNAQTWYWTSQADSSNSQTASQVAVDRNDNPVYTGYCSGSRIAFGNIGINISGAQDDFLAKYNTSGKPLWARCAKALNPFTSITGMSVATDRNNAIIEAGYFTDSIAFGAYHLYSNKSNSNSYIVKYDGNGNVLWATSATATKSQNCENQVYTVATDNQNNILLTGYFEDTAIFGNYTLIAPSSIDMYLVKFNSAGTVIWARTATLGAGAFCYGLSVATDDSCNAYMGGNIDGMVTFGSTPALNPAGETVYLAKYDSSGKAKWSVNTTATPGQICPTPVVVDRSNNVYIGAQFTNASITFGKSVVTDGAPPCSNSLLAKYDRNGNPLWAACADFISQNEVCEIIESSAATDRCNNVYWSGFCSDTFGVGNVKVTIPGGNINQSTPFAYVIQLDSNGNAIAGAALANQSNVFFSNYLVVDSLSKALFVSQLDQPDTLVVVGNDTVKAYLKNSTCFLSKFAVVPAIINSKSSDSICKGDSILLHVVPVKGSTYTWSNGKTTDSATFHPDSTTTYFVAINNGCILDTSFVRVVVGDAISAGIKGRDSICKGFNTELVGSGGATYKWSNGKTTDSISVAPLATTTYTVTSYNGGCSRDTTFTVHVVPPPNAAITASPGDSVCKGDSILLSGSGGISYKWNNGKTTSTIWANPAMGNTYTLYVTGSECSDSTTIKVNNYPPITATVSTLKDSICPHGSTTLTAKGSLSPTTYKWSNGATTSSITVSDTVTTKYTATVYGPCNNVTDSIIITVVPLANISINGTHFKCLGSTDTLTVTGANSYIWGNGSTTDTYITGTINADSVITVTGFNSIGCPESKTFTINVAPPPNVTLTYTNTCLNSPVNIQAVTSGQGPFTYSWAPGGETGSSIMVPDTGQTYTVTVSNGCKTTHTVTLTPSVPVFSACCNEIISIGDDTILIAQGLPNSVVGSYSWSPKVTCLNPTCDSAQVSPTVTTTYTVIGTDSLGCQAERLVTVVVDIPCFNFTVPNVFTPTNSGIYGLDNVFYIKTKDLDAWSISIYDRWGKEMFKSSNPTQYWNGNTEGGGQAPAGVYYYIINATCQQTTFKKDGFVQLIR